MMYALRVRLTEARRSLQARTARARHVFPLSIASALRAAAQRRRELAGGTPPLRIASIAAVDGLPCSVMMWLDRVAVEQGGQPFDVGLRLPADIPCPSLDDTFSAFLTHPGVRSLGLHWSQASVEEDLALMEGAKGIDGAAAVSVETLSAPTDDSRRRFLAGRHAAMKPPLAAVREARMLLKRLARGRYAIALNARASDCALLASVAAILPEARFVVLRGGSGALLAERANVVPLGNYGLSPHERFAIVQSADAYVGTFDEHACVAVAAGRPAVLFGSEPNGAEQSHAPSGRDDVLWLSRPSSPRTVTEVVSFLSRFSPGR